MTRGLHWFRRDLRLRDNHALCALAGGVDEMLPVFVIDPRLVSSATVHQRRTRFLFDCLERLGQSLAERGMPLLIRKGRPEVVLPALMRETDAQTLSFGTGSTPFARRRDRVVRHAVEAGGGRVIEREDDFILAGGEVVTKQGNPFKVYTPYRNAWRERWQAEPRLPLGTPRLPAAIPGFDKDLTPVFADGHGEARSQRPTGGERAAHRRLRSFLLEHAAAYHQDRDRPDRDGTSRLSPYLRMGVISARQCFAAGVEVGRSRPEARLGVDKWLDELIWREFYADLALATPRVLRENAKREYDAVIWNDDPEAFLAWAEGYTGYPIVDAGMRQLNRTGWMHNRVRMIVASFLTKDLLIHWRHGERLFMERLVDGDPASNNGGWQWAASTGSDPQPYFRIFNPVSQGKRCDPDGRYVRRFVPELRGVPDAFIHEPWRMERPPSDYPAPIVDHAERRAIALERFRAARAVGTMR